jgi:hypothetical protein
MSKSAVRDHAARVSRTKASIRSRREADAGRTPDIGTHAMISAPRAGIFGAMGMAFEGRAHVFCPP